MEGLDPFICGINGMITPSACMEIEELFSCDGEYADLIDRNGTYIVRAKWEDGQYGDDGRCEMAPYWDVEVIDTEDIEK